MFEQRHPCHSSTGLSRLGDGPLLYPPGRNGYSRTKNPKEARFSEREYGRFGSYFGYTLTQDKPLVVNYRLWLQEGLMKPEEIAVLTTTFVEPVEVTVKQG